MEINGASRPRLMRCKAPQIVRPRMDWRVEMQGRSPQETLEPSGFSFDAPTIQGPYASTEHTYKLKREGSQGGFAARGSVANSDWGCEPLG